MLDPIHISLLLGLFVGLVLAITGAGGAILSLPLLVFFLNLNMIDAAPISLMAVTLSAGLAAALGLRSGIVRYKAATLLASFGVLCAPLGVLVAHQLPEKVLAILFSVVLLTVSIRSFQKFKTPTLLIGDDCDDPNGCDDNEKLEPACSVNPATSKLFCITTFSDMPEYFDIFAAISFLFASSRNPPFVIAGINSLTVNCSTSGSIARRSFD